jgi:hypothetical protein
VFHLDCLPSDEIIPEEPLKWACPMCKMEEQRTQASVGLMNNNELNDGIYQVGCLREAMNSNGSTGGNGSNGSNGSNGKNEMDEGVKPWTTVLQSRRKLQPILDRLMAMKFSIPVDVTGEDARQLEEGREQHVLFNPFYYLISKARLGSDGLTRKDIEIQKAVSAHLERMEKEGKYKRKKRRKGQVDTFKMFRLPSYFEIVHRPMSLQKIQRKLGTMSSASSSSGSRNNALTYNTYSLFFNDVRLMVNNAKRYYNNANHAIPAAASELLQECRDLIEKSKAGNLKQMKSTTIDKKIKKKKKGKKRKAEDERGGEAKRVRTKVARLGMQKK